MRAVQNIWGQKRYRVYAFVLSALMVVVSFAQPAMAVISTVTSWGAAGTGNGQFSSPTSIAIASNGDVYIGESGNTRIQVFSSTGTFKSIFNNTNVSSPHGMAFDASGNLYVADSATNNVKKFNSSGTLTATIGALGAGNGQFNNPQDIAFDSAGNYYVADYGNNRIQKFNSSNAYVAQWGSAGTGDGQFNAPMGITVDGSNNIYVSEDTNCRVQKFNTSGAFIAKWGSAGSADGQLLLPQHLSADTSGNLYVVDSFNSRMVKYSSTGTFMEKYTGTFGTLYNVRADNLGTVYLVDYQGNQVYKLNDSAVTPAPSNLAPNSPFNLGPSSVTTASTITTNQPTMTFSLSDPNASDTIRYNIQIDDTLNFSSPLVDYTSGLGAQGADSFTVGQSAGTGSYAIGGAGQTLPDAWYYWRVKAIDNSGASSAYVMANGNAIAFTVNTASGVSAPASTATPVVRRAYYSYTSPSPTAGTPSDATSTITLNDYSAYTSGQGQDLGLSTGQAVNYVVDGTRFTAVVKQVTADSAVVTLAPKVGDVTLLVGQPKSYDVTGDGNKDLTVTLLDTTGGVARIRFAAYVKGISTTGQPAQQQTQVAASFNWGLAAAAVGTGAGVAAAIALVLRARRKI